MSELNLILCSLSTRRASGPGTIPADMIKGSPYILKLKFFLLDHFNHCLNTSNVSDSWALSEVVVLVKQINVIHVTSPIIVPSLSPTLCIKFSPPYYRSVSLTTSMTRFVLLNSDFGQNVPLTNLYLLCVAFSKYMKDGKTLYMFCSLSDLRRLAPSPFLL